VLVERNSGIAAQFLDENYAAAGANLVSQEELYRSTDIMLKVRPAIGKEVDILKEEARSSPFSTLPKTRPS
jgi:H+-translocating NAD(P) transhydrogenase